jgi:hypothetical protein
MEQRLERANVAAVPFSWFTAVEAYGDNPGLRVFLEDWASIRSGVPAGTGTPLSREILPRFPKHENESCGCPSALATRQTQIRR